MEPPTSEQESTFQTQASQLARLALRMACQNIDIYSSFYYQPNIQASHQHEQPVPVQEEISVPERQTPRRQDIIRPGRQMTAMERREQQQAQQRRELVQIMSEVQGHGNEPRGRVHGYEGIPEPTPEQRRPARPRASSVQRRRNALEERVAHEEEIRRISRPRQLVPRRSSLSGGSARLSEVELDERHRVLLRELEEQNYPYDYWGAHDHMGT